MTVKEVSQDDCEKCQALSAILEIPPWLFDDTYDVNEAPRKHSTWCRKRAQYEANKAEAKMDKKFIDEMVKAHNEYRSRHQASSLKHSKDLSEFAQKWADHLVSTNAFKHSSCELKGDRLGENIAMKWSSKPDAYTGQEATDQWYSEVKMHTFGGEPRTLSSGHFTQVVWKGSKEMGVGKAQAKDGKTIVVASYRPAGNMAGKFGENVLPPKDGKIILPVQKDTSSGGGPFASRFEEGRPTGGATGGTERKTTRTFTTTEGGVTKTVVEETIIKPDGSKTTTTKETTRTAGGSDSFATKDSDDFQKLHIDDKTKSKSKSKHKRSSSSSSSSSDDEKKSKKKPQKMKEFIDEAVKVHNDLRSKHGVSKLKHSKELSEFAQKWAENLAAKNQFQHSDCVLKGERIGENICCKWSSAGADYTGREACDQWYSEISKHDFATEPRSLGSGHFTQMVWKGSKEMGIGKAKTSGGKVIVVASYRPAGNLVGHFVENVAPLKK